MIHWQPNPEILTFGFIHIRWYSLMFLIGFMTSLKIFKWYCHTEKKAVKPIDTLLYYVVVGTIIGARLGHCLFYEPIYFLNHPIEIFAIWQGGLASHGGGIGVLVSLYLFSKKFRNYSFFWLIDRAGPLVALTGGLIRIGNLINSEIVGKESQVSWAFIFDRIDQLPRHPTQIYESISYFLISALGLSIYKRNNSKPAEGLLFGTSVSLIFICRIIWEFFKENQESFESGMLLNMGQILSLPFVFVGLFFVVKAQRKHKL